MANVLPFETQEMLGRGGMGTVFRTRHPAFGDVAVKMLDESAAPLAGQRFAREARLLARVDDPHVVRAIAYVEREPRPYLVMEVAEGESLEAILARGPLDVRTTCALLRQLARALDAVHAAGIVHADVKPANVVVSARAGRLHATLVDFGVARSHDEPELATDDFPSGTPAAMSPQQILAPKEPVPQWDVWGLAALAYNALTGMDPFGADTLIRILCDALRGLWVPPTRKRIDLPKTIDAVFARAFASAPEDRYPTPEALVSAIEQALLGSRAGARAALAA